MNRRCALANNNPNEEKNMDESDSDFRIPDPVEETAAPASISVDPADLGSLEGLLGAGFTTTDLIITGVSVLVLLGIMLLPRKALITGLTAQFADYARAKAAGNSLYLLLVVSGAAATVALLGNLWTALRFTVPAAVLVFVLLAVFLMSLRAARRSRVGR